jgi:ribosomal protein S6--L-glutamate ligase
MRRSPAVGRFERNLRRGARFEAAELPPAYARAAVEAARVLQLEVCAVDLLDVKGAARVFEVNSSPSIKEAEAACGVDAAGRIVERAVALARARREAPRPRQAEGARPRP